MNRRERVCGCLLLLCAGLLAGCGAGSKAAPVAEANGAAASTAIAPPIVEIFDVPLAPASEPRIPAVLSSEHAVVTLARRDGQVTRLLAQEGARVSRGDELARLDDDDLRAQLRQAELELDRCRIEERQHAAQVEISRTELDQERELLKDGLTSRRQLDRAQYRLEEEQQELEKARLATRAAQARIDAVRVEIDWSVIRAPIAGVVTRRHIQLGAGVVRNDKLFEIAQLDSLEVRFQAPLRAQSQLRPGSLVRLSLVDNDRIVAEARIHRIDPVVDPASNTRGCTATVLAASGLLAGAAVNVRLHHARPGTTPAAAAAPVWIPRAAFAAGARLQRGASADLFLVERDACVSRAVVVDSFEGDLVAIGAGLRPGDRVILLPPPDLKPGDPVAVALR